MAWGANEVTGRVADAVARGGTILTVSPGLARAMQRELDSSLTTPLMAQQPRIFSWRAWTSGLWHRALLTGATDRMLLNRSQENAIWRDLMKQEPAVASLRSRGTLARMASEAWRDLAQHRGLGRLADSATNADTEAFVRLGASFDERCRRDGYLSEARLEGALRQAIRAGALASGDSSLLLCGFDRLAPAREALLEALRDAGVGVEVLPPEALAPERYLHEAEDEAAEMRSAARWARGLLRERPTARIGILAAGLAGDRGVVSQLGRVLREVLAPEAAAIGSTSACLPFEIAGAVPLAGTAAVADALDLLAWAVGPLPLERVGGLLLSPHLGDPREQAARAEFDAFELRREKLLRPEITLDRVVSRLVRSSRRERLMRLVDGLRGMQTVIRRDFAPSERRPRGEWAEAVRELLAVAGWASEPPTDAAEFALRRAWESALDELSTLDFDGRRVGFEEALGMLRSLAEETIHAAPHRDASVQVMAPGEAAGLRFDAVWFLGAGDLGWPGPVAGSPLLGWPLRRELGMPGSNHAADQAHARRMTERIAGSAARVIFSYARETAGGRQRRSPLLSGFGLEPMESPAEGVRPPAIELERVPDDSRISPPGGHVRGGATVLQTQAACGFRAFAQHRLFATEVESRELGMNARERGIAVHRVLEHFWERVRTQSALRAMTSEERDRGLRESVDWALTEAQRGAEGAWDRAYLDTQRQRLMKLVRQWLIHEAGRPVPFTVVQRERKTEDVAIGPLHLTLQVDRVDQTERGAVLIDYKTGSATPAQWLGDRPDEPQLPLYAVLSEGLHLHAIAFGRVRPGKDMGFTGFDDGSGGTLQSSCIPDEMSLAQQIEKWRNVLTELATYFWAGDARVSPKEYPKTCRYCRQRLLCRVDITLLTEEEETESEEGELTEDKPSE